MRNSASHVPENHKAGTKDGPVPGYYRRRSKIQGIFGNFRRGRVEAVGTARIQLVIIKFGIQARRILYNCVQPLSIIDCSLGPRSALRRLAEAAIAEMKVRNGLLEYLVDDGSRCWAGLEDVSQRRFRDAFVV